MDFGCGFGKDVELLKAKGINITGYDKLIVESATAFSMFDKFQVSNGHALIISKKHYDDYFDLTFREQSACMFMLNVSEAAGQTVPHVHIHLIPRYKGDVKEPRDGVRGVIP